MRSLEASKFRCRSANFEDLPAIVRMLADDFLGSQRERYEDPLPESYVNAFREIDADPNNEMIVVEIDGEVVGTLQLTYTPSISFKGGKRCTVGSGRVDERLRGQGIGRDMMLVGHRAVQREGLYLDATNDKQRSH